MQKKLVLFFVSIIMIAVVVVNFSMASAEDSVVFSSQEKGVVKKAPGNAFTVTITFQNTGNGEGSWSVNAVFEGDSWSGLASLSTCLTSAS